MVRCNPSIGFRGTVAVLALLCAVLLPPETGEAAGADIPIIDAHSQVDFRQDMDRVFRQMDRAGVAVTLLAARRDVRPEEILALARRHPGRIVPSLRTKSAKYARGAADWYNLVRQQLRLEGFAAMAEVLMWHAAKFNRRGKPIADAVVVSPGDERIRALFDVALQRRWPFVMHIEFGATGERRAEFMRAMEDRVAGHPEHPFALIHMGQLDAREVKRLIEAHPNLVFLTAHTTPLSQVKSDESWTNLFAGGTLARDWKALVVRYPDRFVMAFDNVWENHWGDFYLDQVALWRQALADLPGPVAHDLAHRNAERLWRLPPLG